MKCIKFDVDLSALGDDDCCPASAITQHRCFSPRPIARAVCDVGGSGSCYSTYGALSNIINKTSFIICYKSLSCYDSNNIIKMDACEICVSSVLELAGGCSRFSHFLLLLSSSAGVLHPAPADAPTNNRAYLAVKNFLQMCTATR